MESKFTILIPSWNNLPYLRLCVESIRMNSVYSHQIVLHLNEGSDGSKEWAEQENIEFSHSSENVGVCHALNDASQLAKTDYIVFMNDDMYVLPDWDLYLWEEIQAIGHDDFFLSSTMIEPRRTGNACVLAPYDYGRSVEDFEEERLLGDYRQFEKSDWQGSTWPPNVVHRKVWEKVGGYSIEFSPGMSSDPDFAMKVWQTGIRYFKGLGESRVYHFQAKSTGKIVKNNGNKQFLKKWGMTQSTFFKYYLRRGEDWKGPQSDPESSIGLSLARLKSRLKRLF